MSQTQQAVYEEEFMYKRGSRRAARARAGDEVHGARQLCDLQLPFPILAPLVPTARRARS